MNNSCTAEDELHTAIIQVAESEEVTDEMSREEILSMVRFRFNSLRKGNKIRESLVIEYGDNQQTEEEEETDI